LKIETITLSIDAYHEDPVSIEHELGKVIGGIQAALAATGHDPAESTFNLAFNLVDPDDTIGWSRYEMYRIRLQLGQIAAVLDGAGEEEQLAPEDRVARRAMLLAHKKELEQELHDLEERDDVTQKNPWE
jgi:DNA-binding transcriptional MerR regulator